MFAPKRGVVIVVSIDRSIIRRIKNGRDLITYRKILVPPYSRGPYSSVV